MRPFQASRVDANQPEIVETFRKLGWSVSCTHAAGGGFPDTIISKYGWLTIVVEIKDSRKPRSARELKDSQRLFFFSWQGLKAVVTCKEDCLRIDQQARKLPRMDIKITGNNDPMYTLALS